MIPAIEEHRAELVELCRRHHVLRLSLFGSATSDDFDPEHSDLDFLVDFDVLTPGEHADAYFGLIEALESLLGRPVDLVERRRCTIRNGVLLLSHRLASIDIAQGDSGATVFYGTTIHGLVHTVSGAVVKASPKTWADLYYTQVRDVELQLNVTAVLN